MADMTNKEALDIITCNKNGLKKAEEAGLLTIEPCLYEAFEVAIKALEQEPILDKIRAEIKGNYRVVLKNTPKDDWAVKWNECVDEVLQIIDKYKGESEGKE